MADQAPVVDRIRIIPRPNDFLDRQVGNSGEVFFDKQSKSLRLFSGDTQGGFKVLTPANITNELYQSGISTVTYNVIVGIDPDGIESGNKYFIDTVYKPALSLVVGYTYVFTQDDQTNEFYPNAQGGTVNQHPLNFSSDNLNGVLGGGTSYTNDVIYRLDGKEVTQAKYWEDFATSTNRSVQITVTSSTPKTLYYWCQQHQNMGNTITVANPGTGTGAGGGTTVDVSETVPDSPSAGNIWFNSTNGKIYVYIDDGDSQQWVQPVIPGVAQAQDGVVNAFSSIKLSDSSQMDAVGQDTITFVDGPGIEITNDSTNNTIIISATATGGGGGGGGVDLTAFSVGAEGSASGDGAISYNNLTGVFTYTPPDLSAFITSENQTLDEVTTAGATTTNNISVGDVTSSGTISSVAVTTTGDITVGGDLITSGSGTPELQSDNEILLTAGTRVQVSSSPFNLASLTQLTINGLIASNGDLVYNSDTNTFQGYEGSWTSFVTSGSVPLLSEVSSTINGATGTIVHNTTTGGVFYHTAPAANFTANFTNVPTTDDRITTVALIIAQGVTQYMPTAVQIGGAAQTIEWFGGSVPGGTANGFDIVSFTLIRQSSTWTVLGASSTYG